MVLNTLLAAAMPTPDPFHLLVHPALFFKGTPFAFNKVAGLSLIAAAATCLLFWMGMGRKLVPKGAQGVAELAIDFVDKGIVSEAMTHGKKWVPLLTGYFWFILFLNLCGMLPIFYMPPTARMALPALLALACYVTFIVTGIVKQGPMYFVNSLFPPGVPLVMKPLMMLIEIASIFIVRPTSLAIRLFANMMAGHILLATFCLMTHFLFLSAAWYLKPLGVLSFAVLILMTALEVFIECLQAYIFTILTAVYIDSSMHAEH